MTCLAALVSCASQRTTDVDPLGGLPEDFGLELSLLIDPQHALADHVALQSSRYVLAPDGTLFYGVDELGGPPGRVWLPPPVRTLSRAQVAEIWSLARQLGFADPASGAAPTNFRLVKTPSQEALFLLRFSGMERRWDFVQRINLEDVTQSAMHTFVDHLARLAWAETAVIKRPQTPQRYDFGPDPYERYRTPSNAK
jgi:hypothetical protein